MPVSKENGICNMIAPGSGRAPDKLCICINMQFKVSSYSNKLKSWHTTNQLFKQSTQLIILGMS
jgi:hypothetical protein